MKLKFLLIALLAPSMLFAQYGKFRLKGTFGYKKPKAVYLLTKNGNDYVVNAAVMSKKSYSIDMDVPQTIEGMLLFDYRGTGVPEDYNLAGRDYLNLLVGDEIIKITTDDSIKNGVIKGSKLSSFNKAYKTYNNNIASLYRQSEDILKEFEALPKERQTEERKADVLDQINDINKELKAAAKSFIELYPKSTLCFDAMDVIMRGDFDPKEAQMAFDYLDEGLKYGERGVPYQKQIEAAANTKIGTAAPDFRQVTSDGKQVKLSDFRGKWVLVDFWASWSDPCRAENPNMVKVYNSYKDKGFTVLGVSLDNASLRDAWLAAIAQDGLTWTQVTDPSGNSNSAATIYGVRDIPSNFLIDPKGRIVAKNLKGDALEAKLAELLK